MTMAAKTFSPWHSWICSRALEGTLDQGPEVGGWLISAQRVAKGWGMLEEKDYPFDPDVWPSQEIEGDADKAKLNRIMCYQTVRDSADGAAALDRNGAFEAALTITDQWYSADEGVIDYPATGEVVGGHCLAFFRYDDDSRKFRFANSWGAGWGCRGCGSLTYDFFNEYMTEGFACHFASRPPLPYAHDVNFARFGLRGHGDILIHICEAYSHRTDQLLGWSFAVQRDGYLEVEELFVKPVCRRQGIGQELCGLLNDVRDEAGLPLRGWVPHADGDPANLAAVDAVLRKIGLERKPSPFAWASFVATEQGDAPPVGKRRVTPPSRPKRFRISR